MYLFLKNKVFKWDFLIGNFNLLYWIIVKNKNFFKNILGEEILEPLLGFN